MKQVIFLLLTILIFACDSTQEKKYEFGLVIHGGAGTIYRGRFSPEEEAEYIDKLNEALEAGYVMLENGGNAVATVERVINILEDSPLFNAGKGAVFNAEGLNELDASIMDGATMNAGAVGGITKIKNPISLAREVMEKSPHVMMVGDGAEKFASEIGMPFVDPTYFFDNQRWEELQNIRKSEAEEADKKMGTVGCAVLDKYGNLAAGTSTGGMTNKKYGRIGDSPIIGAGTYADNSTCAISATGHGEFFIRNVVTYDISARMKYLEETLQVAANYVINDKLAKITAKGGVISIDKYGNVAMPFNTEGMFRGYKRSGEDAVILLYKE
ncbi:MAG: isoaspartyl peptidase/L-asparaginase [Melioribacteraceae bacterium]|nr:MAG: isoaspartyl peptidase/L-asparaginase [Melioribacteraceae bacterium]